MGPPDNSRLPVDGRPAKTIKEALQLAQPRPPVEASAVAKKNYAERFSRSLATCIANRLRSTFPGITPDEDGSAQETPARTARGFKKLDVNYSTTELGLGLSISIKSINLRTGVRRSDARADSLRTTAVTTTSFDPTRRVIISVKPMQYLQVFCFCRKPVVTMPPSSQRAEWTRESLLLRQQ